MPKLPIRTVSMPKDLKDQENGSLNAKLLKPITGGKMHHLAADAFNAMSAAATKAKIELKPTSSADAYRPLSVQEAGFLKRYTNSAKGSVGTPRKYKGKLWWLKKGFAPMAVPQTSNHGWGLAVDIADINQKKLEWLLQNAAAFGFSWELQNEPWHLRYVAGDSVPAAVSAWKSAQPAKAPAKPVAKAPAKPAAKAPAKKPVSKPAVKKPVAKKTK